MGEYGSPGPYHNDPADSAGGYCGRYAHGAFI